MFKCFTLPTARSLDHQMNNCVHIEFSIVRPDRLAYDTTFVLCAIRRLPEKVVDISTAG